MPRLTQLCSPPYCRLITILQQYLRITFAVHSITQPATSQLQPIKGSITTRPTSPTFADPPAVCGKTSQVQSQSLPQPLSSKPISPPQGNIEPYRDPLWTFNSLYYLESHNISCAVLLALLWVKLASSLWSEKKKKKETEMYDSTFTQSVPQKRSLVLWNCPGDHCHTTEVTGSRLCCAWVPPAAAPPPVGAAVLLSCLDFIHSSLARSQVWYIDIIN